MTTTAVVLTEPVEALVSPTGIPARPVPEVPVFPDMFLPPMPGPAPTGDPRAALPGPALTGDPQTVLLGPAGDPRAALPVFTVPPPTGAPVAPPATQMYRKRRRAAILIFLVLAAAVLVVGQFMRDDEPARKAGVTPVGSLLPPAVGPALSAAAPEPSAAVSAAPTKVPARRAVPADAADRAPAKGPVATAAGGFAFATGTGPVLGSTGTLRRYKIAVEKRLKSGDFADEVDRILGDPRSWIAGRQFRLQRVPASGASEFTVYLASARTAEKMCAAGGLRTGGFSSCRLPGQVIINSDRWTKAVPDYDAPLAVYRAYAVNHEVGHQLGHGHEACPGAGEPAPVMMQQTYGLEGCVANSWPYLQGRRYAGNPID